MTAQVISSAQNEFPFVPKYLFSFSIYYPLLTCLKLAKTIPAFTVFNFDQRGKAKRLLSGDCKRTAALGSFPAPFFHRG